MDKLRFLDPVREDIPLAMNMRRGSLDLRSKRAKV
jgi:hypothetical protein